MCADHMIELVVPTEAAAAARVSPAAQMSKAAIAAATTPVARAAARTVVGENYATNAAGLPLLTQRADGQGLKIFLDFDGYDTDTPFSLDNDGTTFNDDEQTNIVETYRDIVSFFSPLDVNVTTVQPPIGGNNPVFVWQLIGNSISGGSAYVNWLTNDSSQGSAGSEFATDRHSGIAHEIGHQLGLNHQSQWNKYGEKTAEYTNGFGVRDRSVIGIDFAENVRTWLYGRDAEGPTNLVDDLGVMSGVVKSRVGGDGYRPDDYANTLAGAMAVPAAGTIAGVIERNADSDLFKFTSTGGTYQIDATPTFESAVSPKIELLNSSGNIISARDDADARDKNNNDQEFSLNLAAGTYYVRVSSSGDQGEQGEYLLTAAPLPAGWASQDVNDPFRAGTAAYDAPTNTLRQLGGGTDIWSTADQFRFTSQTLTGDGSITARVDSLDNVDFYSKAGVMIRQSTAANAPSVYVGIRPSGQLDPIVRSTAGAAAFAPGNTENLNGPWVRITRTGNNFAIANSSDGVNWTTVSNSTVNMNGPVQVGFATGSRRARQAAWSSFSGIRVTGTLGTTAPSTNALPAPAGVTAAAVTAATTGVTLGWTDTAAETGYVVQRSVDGVTYTDAATLAANVVTYADNGLFGSMRYFYRVVALAAGSTRSVPSAVVSVMNKPAAPAPVNASYALPFMAPGAGQISLNWSDVQGDEGYRVERSADNGATYTQIGTTGKNRNAYNDGGLASGAKFIYRITPITSVGNGVSGSLLINAETRLASVSNFIFSTKSSNALKITWTDLAQETGFRLERSTDGTAFNTLANLAAGVTTYTDTLVSPGTEYYYRLVGTTAALDGFTSDTIFTATPTAVGALPTGWLDSDIGAVAGGGDATYSGTTFKVVASGTDLAGAADAFHYVYKAVDGDSQLIARVSALEATANSAKAGLVIRQDLTAGSKMAALTLNAGTGIGVDFHTRTAANVNAGLQNAAPTAAAPYWLKITRTGGTITTATSTNGTTWTNGPSAALVTTGTYYIGMAVAAFSYNELNTSTFDNVSLVGGLTSVSPAVPVLTAASDTGVTGDNRTRFNNGLAGPISFEAPGTVAGSLVELLIDGAVFGTATGTAGSTVVTTLASAGRLADGIHVVTVRQTEPGKGVSPLSLGYSFAVDTTASRVTSIAVNSTAWTPEFRNYLTSHGMGLNGYALPENSTARTLPWNNLNVLTLTFDQPVTVASAENALGGAGVNTAAYVSSAYSAPNSNTATFTFAAAFDIDKLQATLKNTLVTDSAGNALDGEFTNVFSSGNGTPGGDFVVPFNVLPGDATGDGIVLGGDGTAVRAALGTNTASANYNPYADFNGDGIILGGDGTTVRTRLGTSLPAGTPAQVARPGATGTTVAINNDATASGTGRTSTTMMHGIPAVTPTGGAKAGGLWSVLGLGVGAADDTEFPAGLL